MHKHIHMNEMYVLSDESDRMYSPILREHTRWENFACGLLFLSSMLLRVAISVMLISAILLLLCSHCDRFYIYLNWVFLFIHLHTLCSTFCFIFIFFFFILYLQLGGLFLLPFYVLYNDCVMHAMVFRFNFFVVVVYATPNFCHPL